MEGSSLGGWFLSGSGRLSDMEMPVNKRQQGQMGQRQPLMTHQTQQYPLNMVKGVENEQSFGFGEAKELTLGGTSMDLGKGKNMSRGPSFSNNTTSEDEEPSFTEDGNGDGTNSRKEARWQRMKWTDNVIRLLIVAVASVGDDFIPESADGLKRKCGLLHKKGKWKMVSNIMMSKGSCVSPQQCEDKFNDLNKRYKKLNDILGRGTSCQVVETPSLMDSMPRLTNKAKDEVRKILNSKHLFYREMCAYHNGQIIPGSHDFNLQAQTSTLDAHSNGHDTSEQERNDESDDDDDSSDDDEKNVEAYSRRMEGDCTRSSLNEDNTVFRLLPGRQDGNLVQLPAVFQGMPKSPAEQRAWIQQQLWQLDDQKVRLQAEGLDLEKQRFKWLRFRSKKDRELERLRVENERRKLENDRMVLLLKQKTVQLGIPKLETSLDGNC